VAGFVAWAGLDDGDVGVPFSVVSSPPQPRTRAREMVARSELVYFNIWFLRTQKMTD